MGIKDEIAKLRENAGDDLIRTLDALEEAVLWLPTGVKNSALVLVENKLSPEPPEPDLKRKIREALRPEVLSDALLDTVTEVAFGVASAEIARISVGAPAKNKATMEFRAVHDGLFVGPVRELFDEAAEDLLTVLRRRGKGAVGKINYRETGSGAGWKAWQNYAMNLTVENLSSKESAL